MVPEVSGLVGAGTAFGLLGFASYAVVAQEVFPGVASLPEKYGLLGVFLLCGIIAIIWLANALKAKDAALSQLNQDSIVRITTELHDLSQVNQAHITALGQFTNSLDKMTTTLDRLVLEVRELSKAR